MLRAVGCKNGGFNTQPPEGGCTNRTAITSLIWVSTHSRAEAAASAWFATSWHIACFNTQPRGGGCAYGRLKQLSHSKFQHTAARRRLQIMSKQKRTASAFQHTAARRRLPSSHVALTNSPLRFNTQPRGGGCFNPNRGRAHHMSFNTQPRGGGCRI